MQSQNYAHRKLSFGGSCHKYNFCWDKLHLMLVIILLWQNIFVATKNTCLLWQTFCYDKQTFVTTKDMFLIVMANVFVVTKVSLLWQNFCCDKNMFVMTKHVFVMTKLLSWQKWYLWQLPPMIESKCFYEWTESLYVTRDMVVTTFTFTALIWCTALFY